MSWLARLHVESTMASRNQKTYLGDSVYVQINEHGQLILTTENGVPEDPSNRIVMEPEVYESLTLWVQKQMEAT